LRYIALFSRGTTDVEHRVVAAGSRGLAKAADFLKDTGADRHDAKAYGSYEGVYNDEVSWYIFPKQRRRINMTMLERRCHLHWYVEVMQRAYRILHSFDSHRYPTHLSLRKY
jgi:hypothetical protein